MTRKFGIVALAIIISATFAGGMADIFQKRSPAAGGTNKAVASSDVTEDYQEAVRVIGREYAGDVDYEKATQAAIQGMLSTLDPHSLFFPRAEFNKLKEDQDSRLIGIGVTILRHRDGVYVQSAVQGTPAARAGLRYGDRIVEVDGKDARDWTSEQVSKNVRGERGEPVRVKIERAGSQVPITYTIIRESVPLPSIRNAYMIHPGTGYIGLTGGFQHTTGDELHEAITRLKSQGMRQIVLDLRGNPGGLLDQAIEVASEFLPRGQVIVSVHGRVEYKEPYFYRSTGADPEDFPLVVIINHNSASASEIVAGAIQDHGRGLIVGQTSFGKGLVQRIFQLPFGAGLTLTTAKYYTPYGRSLQRDYSSGSLYDYYVRHDEDEQLPQPKTPRAPSAQGAIDPALAQPTPTPAPTPPPAGPAVKTAAGRIFYGGGGITPDIEAKPLQVTPLRGRIAEAAFFFTRELAAGQIPGLEAYRVEKTDYDHTLRPTDYPVTDAVVKAFRDFVQRDGKLGLQPAQIDEESDFVKLRVRDEIITAAYASDAGARVLIDNDPQVLRALEVLPEAKRLAESVKSATPIS
ncbi:MAG: carboxyl-terminal processing protease [Acidobacteriota bacterium]|jgi:carboxyl-terminal processing protease|nr:carboxyl-terminal processing protease [Acidobacteriota bacterium]